VLATLRAGVTAFDLEHRQHLSTRYGFPNLSPYTVLRFAPRPSGDGALELCSVQVDPRSACPGKRRRPERRGGRPGTVI
jgi:hypothetical protein